VTGAAGFIGSHVVRALVSDGHEVRALHLPTDDLRNLRELDVERFPGDVTDRETMRRATQGRDHVFHLAAVYALWLRDPERMRRVNVEGSRIVFEEARRASVSRVVYTSSIACFGGQGPRSDATETSPFRLGATGDLYSKSKQEAHELAVSFAREIDLTIVAPTGPIGPGDVGPTPTGRLLLSALTLPLAVVTRTSSNFADVRDMARGHLLAAERGVRGETYLLGTANVDLPDLVRMAYAITGQTKRIVVAPFCAARVAARAAVLYADKVSKKAPLFTPEAVAIAKLGLRAECSKARRDLELPQGSIEDALRDSLVWFAREGCVHDARVRKRLLSYAA
ncbi:MAG: NAD-dependent epimerase/dehydratase family protein, partial [Polyangiaceae bacterium]